MSGSEEGISRRHALRLVLGQGGEVARERDRRHLELDQESALEGAQSDAGSAARGHAEPLQEEESGEA